MTKPPNDPGSATAADNAGGAQNQCSSNPPIPEREKRGGCSLERMVRCHDKTPEIIEIINSNNPWQIPSWENDPQESGYTPSTLA